IERASNRRCWYLKGVATRASSAGSVESAPSSNADGQTTIMSWLSSKIEAITRPSSAGAEQTATTRDSIATKAVPESRPRRRARVAKRFAAAKVIPPKLSQPASQPSPPAPLPVSAEPATAAPFDPARREELFKEYLEWQKRQGPGFR